MIELFRRSAHNLENNGHSTFLAVIIRYRKGNTFSVFVHTQNDELSGKSFSRDERSVDYH